MVMVPSEQLASARREQQELPVPSQPLQVPWRRLGLQLSRRQPSWPRQRPCGSTEHQPSWSWRRLLSARSSRTQRPWRRKRVGRAWRTATAQKVLPKLSTQDQVLLKNELAYQQELAVQGLPHGVVHGDLFRDNVLFDNEQLGGFIDFYYACNDVLAYDVAIAVNEWCVHHNGADLGNIDDEKVDAFLSAYQSVRPLTTQELACWPALLRRAALRFWLSRLQDFQFPQLGEITHAKDPNHFKSILQARIAQGK